MRYHLALGSAALVVLVSGAYAVPLTVTVTDSTDKPLADAVVAVMVRGTRTRAAAGTSAQIAQRERQFLPQVTVIQTGTSVSFPNLDTVRHHVYSFSPIQRFELKLYAGVPAAPVLFDTPGTATLGCNIHDRMSAWVYVVDTPYFAKTDVHGQAQLDVPAGAHRLRASFYRQPDSASSHEQPLHIATSPASMAVKLSFATPEN